jgi:hypothetical protein
MSKSMPFQKSWHETLARELDANQADALLTRVQERYDALVSERAEPSHRALVQHLDGSILPGLALYQVLVADGWDKETAQGTVERLFAADLRKRRRVLEWMGRTPLYFSMLKRLTPRLMARSFPPEGWTVERVEMSSDVVAFNMHSCFYLDTLRDYGAAELTPVYCRLDDVMYDGVSPYVNWERTRTLGVGDDHCNFRFRRMTDGRGDR